MDFKEAYGFFKEINGLEIKDEKIQEYCNRYFKKLDFKNPNEKLLGCSYYYARNNGLRDYQARSFSSEVTAFLTNRLYDTDVSLVYREEWLDSYLFNKFNQCPRLDDFIKYMVGFYKSSKSWKYERVGKYLQFKITKREKRMFRSLPAEKQIDKFNWLLRNYDYSLKEVPMERDYPQNSLEPFSINLCTSQYECFMRVVGKTKTQKFLNLLYYGVSKHSP